MLPKPLKKRIFIACLTALLAACSQQPGPENALLAPWTGPYGGVPAFDRMELADLEPALEAAMAIKLSEIEAIAGNPEPPDFDNTLVALEDAGRDLDRVEVYLGIWRRNLSSPEFREINARLAPRLAEFNTAVYQNRALFERIRTVFEGEALAGLDPQQQRLVRLTYERFVRNGATLTGEARERYAAINGRLAELQTRFAANILADEENYVVYLVGDQLGGLPDSLIESAASAARARGREGEYAITNTRSSMDPFLTFSDQRALREEVWRNYYNRGDNGGEHDNNLLIAEILKLRQERSALLGFDNYAQWRLQDRMAGTPERAMELLMDVWPAAVALARQEVADMQALADAEGAAITIEPWDYRYYAEKVRKARFDIDSEQIKQYLQLDKLREAMFFVADELFGFTFMPVPDGSVPVFHEDVRAWEVRDRDTGSLIGLWYLDPFARQGKRSGAWAVSFRSHETVRGKPVILSSNNSNFVAGEPGQPVLISWDDARTLFHEFGHALHALSSRVDYLSLNTGVRDYTEFQSQLLEHWVLTDPVIERYLVHVETGEPIPADLVARIRRAERFNQGFATTEYLASALMDLKFHTADPSELDPDAFERETLAELGMPGEIVMRHRSPHFGHVFSSEGYSAGYYGYMWADVLTADAAEAFAAAPGGYYDPDLAEKLVDNLFAPRNAVDPAEAYRIFRGRDPDTRALLRDRGFLLSDD
ncbi:MAG: M3 family metallopeptidase [Gammaproteobacteria bacterium]|jgi:peptidyl-dipeptidase Dcp